MKLKNVLCVAFAVCIAYVWIWT